MITNTKLWYLEQTDIGKRLNKKERLHLTTLLSIKSYRRGDYIVLPESRSHKIFILKKGMAKVVHIQESGAEHLKYIIKEGALFGELSLTDKKSTDAIIAIEYTLVSSINTSQLKMLMQQYPNLNNYIYRAMEQRIHRIENRLNSIIYKKSETRVKDFIFDFVKNFGKKKGREMIAKNFLSNKDIGKLTYTSRQTVNSVFNYLRNQNLIQYDSYYIRISITNLISEDV